LRVVEDPAQLEIVEHKQERKWARRKMWQPFRRFDIIRSVKPSRTIMQMGDMLIMHPEMAKEVRAAIDAAEKPKNSSVGASTHMPTVDWMPDIPIKSNRDIAKGLF